LMSWLQSYMNAQSCASTTPCFLMTHCLIKHRRTLLITGFPLFIKMFAGLNQGLPSHRTFVRNLKTLLGRVKKKQGRRQRRSATGARSRRTWRNVWHVSKRRNDWRNSWKRNRNNRENCRNTNFTLSRLCPSLHLSIDRWVANCFSLVAMVDKCLVVLEPTLEKLLFKIKERTMDNVQNCDGYVNIPLSQTYRSYQLWLIITHSLSSEGLFATAYENVVPQKLELTLELLWKILYFK
jgi:hypothetical protein